MLSIKITNYKELKKALDKFPGVARREINKAIDYAIHKLQQSTMQEAPHATGTLKSRIKTRLGNLWGRVWVDVGYGIYVHEGTRPHWAPIRPLKLWARKKFGDERIAYAVQRVIARRGTKANPFMQRAIDKDKNKINKRFDKALDNIIKKI